MRIPPNNQLSTFILPLVLILCSGLLVPRYLRVFPEFGANDLAVIAITGAILGAILHIFIHECGHILGALVTGLDIREFGMSVFSYNRNSGWYFNPNRLFFSGYVSALPKTTMSHDRIAKAFQIFYLSGPIVGLLFVGVCWMIAISLPVGLFTTLLVFAIIIGIGLNLLSLIPRSQNGNLSDGAQFLILVPNSKISSARIALLELSVHARKVRPRDWPLAVLERAAGTQGHKTLELHAQWFQINHALDIGEYGQAKILIERADTVNSDLSYRDQTGFIAEKIYLYSMTNRVLEARSHLAAAEMKYTSPSVQIMRSRAVVLLAEGQITEARVAIESSKEISGSIPDRFIFESSFISNIEEMIKSTTVHEEMAG